MNEEEAWTRGLSSSKLGGGPQGRSCGSGWRIAGTPGTSALTLSPGECHYHLLWQFTPQWLSNVFRGHAVAKSRQSCPTLCDPIDGSPPGSPVPGILQARTLEWVAISFSNA